MQNDLSKILRMRKLKVELDLEEGGDSAPGPRSTLPGISRAPLLLLQTIQAQQTLGTNLQEGWLPSAQGTVVASETVPPAQDQSP